MWKWFREYFRPPEPDPAKSWVRVDQGVVRIAYGSTLFSSIVCLPSELDAFFIKNCEDGRWYSMTEFVPKET